MDKKEKEAKIKLINQAIDTVRPYLNADGGDVTFLDLTDNLVVKLKLSGACDGCPFSLMTLKSGIEQAIRKKVPEIKEVLAID